jgi:hypothetical protein
MAISLEVLDQKQAAYKTAVEEWVAAIRHEETLASVNHDLAELDTWEMAGEAEEELRNAAKLAKREYEDALREEFFNF